MPVKLVISKNKPLQNACFELLQMLSGLFLAFFLIGHALLVASSIFSLTFMDDIAARLEASYLAHIGGTFVFLIFLFHFFLAVRKVPLRFSEQEALWKEARLLKHQDTWLWALQALSGMLILLFGAIHMWVTLNDFPIQGIKSAARVQSGLWFLFYLFFIPLVQVHLFAGLYRIGIKWGWITPQNRLRIRQLLSYCLAGLVSLGLVSLLHFYFIGIHAQP